VRQRVFFDSSVLGAAHALVTDWPLIVFPGHPDWPLKQDAADEVWLSYVGERGWVAVFRDKRIRYRAAEWDALTRHKVRSVNLTTRRNLKIRQQAELFERTMPRIVSMLAEPAGYYHLTLGGLELKRRHDDP